MRSQRLLQGWHNVIYLKQYFGWPDQPSSGLDFRVMFCGVCLSITIQNFSFEIFTIFLNCYFLRTCFDWPKLPFLSLLVILTLFCFNIVHEIPYGLAVRIPGFHPGGPGSTPGMGTHFLVFKLRRRFPCFFYQGLRLVTVNLSKWEVLLQQLCYENFFTRCNWASKESKLLICWFFFSTIRLARLVKWIWISISLTFKYSTSQYSEHRIQLLMIGYFEELHHYFFISSTTSNCLRWERLRIKHPITESLDANSHTGSRTRATWVKTRNPNR